MKKEYTLFQILVLCGTDDEKHGARLTRLTGNTENTISTWSTRGIPTHTWQMISKESGCTLLQIAEAHARVSKISIDQQIKKLGPDLRDAIAQERIDAL